MLLDFPVYGLGLDFLPCKALEAQGEGYGKHIEYSQRRHKIPNPDWKVSVIPLILVIVLNVFLSNPFHWDWAFHWDESSLESLAPMHISLLAHSVARFLLVGPLLFL